MITRSLKEEEFNSLTDEDFMNYTETSSVSLNHTLSKREYKGIFRKTNKNIAIWGIVLSFLLVPIFFGGFVITFGAIVAVLLWTMFFISPLANKILFGSW